MCQIEMNDLAQYGMIEQDFYTNGIKPTHVGILMSKYYMTFDTIKIFKEVSIVCSLQAHPFWRIRYLI